MSFSVTAGLAWRVCGSALLMQMNSRFQVHDGFKLLQGMDLHHHVQSQPGSHAVQLRQILCRQGGCHQIDGIRPETMAWQIMAG